MKWNGEQMNEEEVEGVEVVGEASSHWHKTMLV